MAGSNNFINTISAPISLSYDFNLRYSNGISTFYGFKAVRRESNGKLRYDPSTEKILIHQNDGLYCLKSTQQGVKGLDAALVDIVICSDKYAAGVVPTNLRWKITSSSHGSGDNKEYQIFIENFDGNVFGIDNLILVSLLSVIK